MSTALTQTTLSSALSINGTVLNVASATGINAPLNNFYQQLYVIGYGQKRGELMNVVAVSGTQITVARISEYRAAYNSGALVLIGLAPLSTALFAGPLLGGGSGFFEYNPPGTPGNLGTTTDAANNVPVTPWVNVVTGDQWIYSSVVNAWVPGWQNEGVKSVSAAVASVANPITPSGPLFHVTGNSAITGITRPIGFSFGEFTIIPDGIFTWTTGDGSIALAGTAVVSKQLKFIYDPAAALWYPSYTS